MPDENSVSDHKGLQITVTKEDRGYFTYTKHLTRPSTGAGVSMGNSIIGGPYEAPEKALEAAKAAIDKGDVW
jgi:hypothetical protein